MAIRCGRCPGTYHASVADVRKCFNGETVEALAAPGRPVAGTGSAPVKGFQGPTEKQTSYVEKLLENRGVEFTPGIGSLSKTSISEIISLLKGDRRGLESDSRFHKIEFVSVPGLPGVTVPSPSAPGFDPQSLEDGFYVYQDDVYKVIIAHHGSGRKYAKVLDKKSGEWDMARSAVRNLRPEHMMTLPQALEVAKAQATNPESRLYGRCFKCGKVLTKEESIARFMGDRCAGSF